jgi:D-alanyl-D-alanine carboxypeptidase/D-alanyl-D-alanine-endopeptidase (penicillin-binding protein 4)
MRHRCAVIALALLLPACAARTSTPALGGAVKDAREQLRRELQSLFTAPEVRHAQWGVSFYSLSNTDTVYSLNAGQFMIPASNQKILTTAVAAERLGWDFRFTTRLLATGPLDDDGTITGDVVVVGSGDPTINPRHPERWRIFDEWAAALRARGVKIINGSLVGEDNAFAEPGWGVGWAWDNLQYGYGAPPSALQYNENQVEVMIGPGIEAGTRAIISTAPYGSGLVIDHDVTTIAPDGETQIDIARIPGTAFLRVRGHIAAGAKPVTLTASVDNPTRLYLAALREALARHGIFVAGGGHRRGHGTSAEPDCSAPAVTGNLQRHVAAEQHGHRHPDAADHERADEADHERLGADSFEHREAGVEPDRCHGGAEKHSPRPKITD